MLQVPSPLPHHLCFFNLHLFFYKKTVNIESSVDCLRALDKVEERICGL